MKMIVAAACLALLAGHATLALADPAGAPLNSQQQRMKDCNARAGQQQLHGGARKDFMSHCLKGEAPAPAPMTPQQRMKDCNAKASAQSLKGDARKHFMSDCLKAH